MTYNELRARSVYNSTLVGANLERADLRGVDLRGVNLTNANLRGADLSRADLRGAILIKTDFSRANLHLVDFENADMTQADMSMSYGRRANFSHARMYSWWYNPLGSQKMSYKPIPGWMRLDESVMGGTTVRENAAREKVELYNTRSWEKSEDE